MSKYLDPEMGCWIVKCDWADPVTGETCTLGTDGEPRKFIDPDGGRDPEMHFQCGQHHGYEKQERKPEYQLPEGHKLNQEVISPEAETVEVEEVEDDRG